MDVMANGATEVQILRPAAAQMELGPRCLTVASEFRQYFLCEEPLGQTEPQRPYTALQERAGVLGRAQHVPKLRHRS